MMKNLGELMRLRQYCIPDPRAENIDEILLDEIEAGSRVIDLGCGDGRLLHKLREEHECFVQGVELDMEEVLIAMHRGVPVLRADLDNGLQGIPDDSFDFAVLSQTLQQVRHTKELLTDMLRVAKKALVVVPNFAHWRVRFQLAFYGRAPVTEELPYQWYDSPNVHVMSMIDFQDLVKRLNLRVIKELPIIRDRAVDRAWAANWRAVSVLYVLERASEVSHQ